jgi:hypothetical protein
MRTTTRGGARTASSRAPSRGHPRRGLLFTAASVVPFLSNTKAEESGMWKRDAELLNGRAAMIGMLALLGFEAVKHVPCL